MTHGHWYPFAFQSGRLLKTTTVSAHILTAVYFGTQPKLQIAAYFVRSQETAQTANPAIWPSRMAVGRWRGELASPTMCTS